MTEWQTHPDHAKVEVRVGGYVYTLEFEDGDIPLIWDLDLEYDQLEMPPEAGYRVFEAGPAQARMRLAGRVKATRTPLPTIELS